MSEEQKINVNIDFIGPLIAVENVGKAQKFYENVAGQKLKFDLGACRQFESGLTLQSKASMTDIFGFKENEIKKRSNNFTLYFETADFEAFAENLKKHDLEYVHGVIEFTWGQRSVSFYDLDDHVVDVSEKMETVIKRFAAQGMTQEEIAARTEHPIEFVTACLK
ncbi:MAG: glyoxalase/bleomycin resistance/dioxygenase family protein [Methanosarcinales archaeon]|jgi:predicted enzyme related to lactoylglutathione lyase|nr:glyoxalase/bleomycin resistance/dioxygenase family protein [Methanosarcinales archaeon]